MKTKKYVCFSKHGTFVFQSDHRLGSNNNIMDAVKAYAKKTGTIYPSYQFLNIVHFEDYPVDEPAIS